MNINLMLTFGIVLVTLLVPISALQVGAATLEWSKFWQIRTYLVNYSGIVSMILMSMCITLSVKHWPLERWLGGLDKQYRLHKYLGISAVFSVLFHWMSFLSDDFAMDLGYVAAKDETYPFWKLIDSLGDPAQLIGEFGFYFSAAFVLIAWIKKFKHNVFQLTHKVLPYLYLLLVLHMIMFFDASLWLSFPGAILFIVSGLATVGCLITIFNLNGTKKRYKAQVKDIKPINNGIEVTLKIDAPEFVYQSGQFAFVGFDDKERPHPFSLASPYHNDGNVRLMIKANGDYTNSLMNTLAVGQMAQIEGPYGCFNFQDDAHQHIWFAAGIGIAPFLTAIEMVGKAKVVNLFYSYREEDKTLLAELQQRAKQVGISLHLRNTSVEDRFSSEEVISYVEKITHCSVWFCGPSELGKTLERDFIKANLPARSFHRELFEFR
ncbi:ferric reductase-like transmembrane domain-containing protein [Moritella sp. 24]|uniref:ferredoxin reductase family protein n=1 Tax=Moritella sp. 24 TaxID=2746230 RepID=UPI001BAA8A02|nr:ferric reductase-like transmembrane domain-containing protein [Moritella sp. 24]